MNLLESNNGEDVLIGLRIALNNNDFSLWNVSTMKEFDLDKNSKFQSYRYEKDRNISEIPYRSMCKIHNGISYVVLAEQPSIYLCKLGEESSEQFIEEMEDQPYAKFEYL